MNWDDIKPHVEEIEKQLDLLKKIGNPNLPDDESRWNVGGILNIVARHSRDMNSVYWQSRRDKKRKPAYWERMEIKERDKKLAENRQEKTQWDKGAD